MPVPAGTPSIDGVAAPLLMTWSTGQATRVHQPDPARVYTIAPAWAAIPPRPNVFPDVDPQPAEEQVEEPIEEEIPFEEEVVEEPAPEPEPAPAPVKAARTARS